MAIDINMDTIRETFFQECDEHVVNMEELILKLEENPDDDEMLNSIFRSAHSIKGNSGTIGFSRINEFTHTLESVLERLRSHQLKVNGEITNILLKSVDCVKGMLAFARDGRGQEDVSAVSEVMPRLEALLSVNGNGGSGNQAQSAESVQRRIFEILFEPSLNLVKKGYDPKKVLDVLKAIGTIISMKPEESVEVTLDDQTHEPQHLSWKILISTSEDRKAVEAIFDAVDHESIITITDLSKIPSEKKLVGSILIDEGELTKEQLTSGLLKQKKIGQILVEDGHVTHDKILDAVKKQEIIKRADTPSIRVDVEKIDKLVNLVGELVITQSMIAQLTASPSVEQFGMLRQATAQLTRNTREIQERVMSIRMLPIGTVFNRFTRLVRDMSLKRGKKANLVISGEETELDKTVIEKVIDPLTHLIRNAVDHGIETPEERTKNSKAEVGKIHVNAYHEGGHVIVIVTDDGKGLDRNKIVSKALEKGLIEEQTIHSMTDSQIYSLIFLPGFSTADEITDVSGRGVGMDVVKKNIESLGGSVSLETEKGLYTKVHLRIPLTLAIIDGLSIKIGEETYIIPIASILESKRPLKDEVKMIKGEGEVVAIRGNYIPLIRLHKLFHVSPQQKNPWEAIVVIVKANGGRYGILVDELTGQQQVVIKSMGDSFKNLPGVAGATILGDGKVSLILDMEGMVRDSMGHS